MERKEANRKAAQEKRKLYSQFVEGSEHAAYNKKRIDFVVNKVYRKQLRIYNRNEEKVKKRLLAHGLTPEQQYIIPIQKHGGKLDHIYIADMVVGTTIIEVDGPQHEKNKKWDEERDRLTAGMGFSTIRIPTSDLSPETIDSYLQGLWMNDGRI